MNKAAQTSLDVPERETGRQRAPASGHNDRRLQELLTVNRLGSLVWDLLDGGSSVDDIARVIALEFELPGKTAQAEARGFIRMFAEAEMVSVTR